MAPVELPTIPPSVSFQKRVMFTHILQAIGPDGNYRSNIDNRLKPMVPSTIGRYLQEMKYHGMVVRKAIPDGRARGWIPKWEWVGK